MSKKAPIDTRGNIIDTAIPLFAGNGYSGVSVRTIAKLVGISAAALYHHFPDKQSLYLAAMEQAFADKAQAIIKTLTGPENAWGRLDAFLADFIQLMGEDADFRALLQRELLDGDDARLQLLAEQVFREPFEAVSVLMHEINPDIDSHLMAISIAGLVLFHFDSAPIRRFLPGGEQTHDQTDVVFEHIQSLLHQALSRD